MNEPAPVSGRDKLAWFEVAHSAPPKRSATERVADFLEIYGCYDEATARAQARRCVQCPEALCVAGCPLGSRIPEWMLLTAEGQFLEAAALTRSTSNMPEICARVCPQERLCEGACILNGKAEPVSIGAIEKFLNEYAFAHGAVDAAPARSNGFRVAVLGAGPGGLSCADELARRGYQVTVFESRNLPGGLLVGGIPAFKLERDIVFRRVEILRRRGVEFRLGVTVGREAKLEELQREFDAIFLGFGAQQARPLDVPGADLPGVWMALPFIVQHNTDVPLDIAPEPLQGRRIVVLGGGDTAMDCLRISVRRGVAEAHCVYRRDAANMAASRREYENALEEGARFTFQATPVEILRGADGRAAGVRCQRVELGPPDASGRCRPIPQPRTEFEIPADLVVAAFGFEAVPFPANSELGRVKTTPWGSVIVDKNQMTSLPGVFAGGDLVRGPSLVVQAVRDARKAAAAIHRYLIARRLSEGSLDATDHMSTEAF